MIFHILKYAIMLILTVVLVNRMALNVITQGMLCYLVLNSIEIVAIGLWNILEAHS